MDENAIIRGVTTPEDEKEDLLREKIEYDSMDDLYTAQDEWIKECYQELMEEFCKDNDDFKDFCREEYKMYME